MARRLVAERGIGALTMDELAQAARVGKGTLYRAFGSRAGLAEALVDEAERELQERILTGPPPLGYGPGPAERLGAFVDAYLAFLSDNDELVLETERPGEGARFHTGAYGFWHAHIAALLREEGTDDGGLRAHVVLATLAAELHAHLRSQGYEPDRIRSAIQTTMGLSQVTRSRRR